ncbi:T9SS type A sorting domain-containing protein [Fluviicola taffensis]|uniref:T9SS type A sorting domain-containing protein n=1 Tax=Fluviicola taffensis TaxID=191579 RepID=UPI003138261F
MKKQVLIYILPLFIFGMGVNNLKAQTPFSPNTYSGWVSTPTNSFATIPAAPGVLFTQVTRGAGNTFSTAADGINSSKWNNPSANAAITANQHLTFSVSANSATTFEIDSLSIILGRSNTGPDSCILQYKSINTGNSFVSVASGVRIILAPSSSPTTILSFVPPSPILASANDTVVFRLVAWHASSALGTMKMMNNSTVYGKVTPVVTNSIAAPVVQTNHVSCVSSIQGDSVQITFNSNGVFNPGNTYSLELSDASGSFSSPLVLGVLNSSLNTGTINGFIPASTSSANYQLRIKSSNPVINGLDTTHLMVYPGMILNASVLQPSCPDSTGEIDLTITGGTGTIQYNWSNSQSTPDLNNLTGGTYGVNITDVAGCTADSSFTIQSVPGFVITDSISPVSCHSEFTGMIELTVAGATAPYSISWSGNGINQTGLVANNLAAGTYSVSITDANNCPYSNSYLVTEPAAITVSDSIANVACHDESNGSISVSVGGGTAPYSISWSGNGINQTGLVANNLAAGTYSVSITDANNCPYSDSYAVTEPAVITVSDSIANAACHDESNGSISVSVGGGTAPYSISWSGNGINQTGLVANNLAAGTYSVSITDANNCPYSDSYAVTEPAVLNVSASITNASCSSCNGSISLSVNGGTAPYSFDWDNNSTLQTISAVPGTYCVTVSDMNACESDSCFTISSTAGLADDATDSGIQLFPNPATEAFQIVFSQTWNGSEKELTILNSLGEIILQKTIDPSVGQEVVHVQSWTRGVYIYQIRSESGEIEKGKINLVN